MAYWASMHIHTKIKTERLLVLRAI